MKLATSLLLAALCYMGWAYAMSHFGLAAF